VHIFSKSKGLAAVAIGAVLLGVALATAIPAGAKPTSGILSGSGDISNQPGALVSVLFPDGLMRDVTQDPPPVTTWSGFITSADPSNFIDGHTIVIDDAANPADVPVGEGDFLITLHDAHVGGLTGDIFLEERAYSGGFIASAEGLRGSIEYIVLGGTGDFKKVTGGGVGGTLTSFADPANPVSSGHYWMRLEFK
jgi:hypothetical protein